MTKNILFLLAATASILTMGAGCATQTTTTQTSPGDTTAPSSSVATTTAINVGITNTTTTATTPWATKVCSANQMSFEVNQPLPINGQFQGMAIADIAKNYLALSGAQAAALTATTSPDGSRLIVTYVSCDGATDQGSGGLTMVTHVVAFTGPAAATGRYLVRLPTLSGANFLAMYIPIGFVNATSNVLIKGQLIGLGAGGSCATTRWMTADATTAATTTFSTGPDAIVYGKNTRIVYVNPSSCFSPPQSILVKNVSSGSLQPLKKFDINTYVSLQAVTEQPVAGGQNQFVLHYSTHDIPNSYITTSTIVLP